MAEGAQVQIISEPRSVQIKGAQNLCRALESAGFNPQWTMTDIEELKKTKSGRDLLGRIDIKVRNVTGLQSLTNKDLTNCYPHYITDYICRRGSGPPIAKNTGNYAAAPDKERQYTKLVKVPKDKYNIFPGSVKHCYWDSLKKDLDQSITDNISSNIDQHQKLITTLYHLKLRTELEVRNLINMFQSKTKIEWLEFFRASVEREPKGYHIEGTTYYIPWDLFRKYDVCFGGHRN